MKSQHLTVGAVLGLLAGTTLFLSSSAMAGSVSDTHGNVGYDTAAECDAAVQAGTAKFYEPYTHSKPRKHKGEKSVKTWALGDVTIPQDVVSKLNYSTAKYAAACDLGNGHSLGRSGVAKVLLGKYVPFSAQFKVRAYYNKNGEMVRLTMHQCDNHFSASFPRPVPLLAGASGASGAAGAGLGVAGAGAEGAGAGVAGAGVAGAGAGGVGGGVAGAGVAGGGVAGGGVAGAGGAGAGAAMGGAVGGLGGLAGVGILAGMVGIAIGVAGGDGPSGTTGTTGTGGH